MTNFVVALDGVKGILVFCALIAATALIVVAWMDNIRDSKTQERPFEFTGYRPVGDDDYSDRDYSIYDWGYADGFVDGQAEGFAEGFEQGEIAGFDDAVALETGLGVTAR